MVRVVAVVLTVVLFLIFAIPLQWMLKEEEKRNPQKAQEKSLGIVQSVFRFIFRLAGITYEVQGLENIPSDRAVLYVGNHRSYFDILIGYITVPGLTGFVAKKEMSRIPLLRDWMERVNCLFLDRKNIKEGLKTILAGIEKIRHGVSVWIFPEGTRNTSQDIADLMIFHEGSLKIAEKSGCPIVPVAIKGTADLFENHQPWVRPGHVVIRYGKPIYLKELTGDARKFPGSYTRNVISSMLKELSEEQREN